MEIYRKSSEEKLVALATAIKGRMSGNYCVTFHLSHLSKTYKNSDLIALFNMLKEETVNATGGIYLCSDSDLFIIFQSAKKEFVDKIITKVKFFYADDPVACQLTNDNASKFITQYDIAGDYENFFLSCNNKLLNFKKKQEELQSKNDNNVQETTKYAWQRALQNKKQRGNRLSILIIEDQMFSRHLLTESLKKHHSTLSAENACEGLNLYMLNAPDIVFLDIELPDHDGFYVLERILKTDPTAFVVMTTANNLADDVKRAIGKGAKGYIVKPFTKTKVHEYINLYISKFKNNV